MYRTKALAPLRRQFRREAEHAAPRCGGETSSPRYYGGESTARGPRDITAGSGSRPYLFVACL
eukprot:5384585-Heterocapsa_arctica.AAC.1